MADRRDGCGVAGAVCGTVRSQGEAADVSALRGGARSGLVSDCARGSQPDGRAGRAGRSDRDRLHHFVSDGVWDEVGRSVSLRSRPTSWSAARAASSSTTRRCRRRGRIRSGSRRNTRRPWARRRIAKPWCLTLARDEVPVMVGLRLFLPETWTGDEARLERAGVPADIARRGPSRRSRSPNSIA